MKHFIDSSGIKDTKQFIYLHPFGIHFRYVNQVDDQNNQRHVPISLEGACSTKLYPDRNFTWYLSVLEVNIDLASGHFQNDGVVQPSLYFQRYFAIECLENKIGVESGQNGLPNRIYKLPMYVNCEKITVKHHGGMCDPKKNKGKVEQKYQKQRCQNYSKFSKKTRVDYNCSKIILLCSVCFIDNIVGRVRNFQLVTNQSLLKTFFCRLRVTVN